MNRVKKFFSTFKKSSYRKEREAERDRLFFRPVKETSFKKRKKLPTLKIPTFISGINLKKRYISYYLLGLWCIVLLWLLISIFWPFFRIKNIEIIRKEDITNINIAYRSVEEIRGESLFLINSKDIAESLKNYQKNIKWVVIKKDFPDSLKITIESYKGVFYVVLNEKTYIVTENGVLIPGRPSEWMSELKFVEKYRKAGWILDYKQVYSSSYIESIFSLKTKLEANIVWTTIVEMYYFPLEREVHYTLSTGNTLIFDLDGKIEDQIKKLLIFHKEQSDLSKVSIRYTDLRIKWKIFFCPMENEFQCFMNLVDIYGYGGEKKIETTN